MFRAIFLGVNILCILFLTYHFSNENNVLLKKERITEVYEAMNNADFANEKEAFYCPQFLILNNNPQVRSIIEKLPSTQNTINQHKSLCEAWIPEFYEKFTQKYQFEKKPSLKDFYAEPLWAKVMTKLYNQSKNSYMKALKVRQKRALQQPFSMRCHYSKNKDLVCSGEIEKNLKLEK